VKVSKIAIMVRKGNFSYNIIFAHVFLAAGDRSTQLHPPFQNSRSEPRPEVTRPRTKSHGQGLQLSLIGL